MRQRPNALMLFAAGFGTRMGALTKDLPKPMLPVAGRPLIDHTLDLADATGFEMTLANLHYKPDPLQTHLAARSVETLLEKPDILDTGGGLKNALPHLGDQPVVTSNTDAIWQGPNPFDLILRQWNPDQMDALLLCTPLKNCVGHSGSGDFIMSPDGLLTRGPADVVYGGIQILNTDLLKTIPDAAFSLNVIWDKMLTSGRLFGTKYPGKWCDVGTPEGIRLAEDLLRGDDV